MKKKNDTGRVLLWVACVLSFATAAFNVFAIVMVSFDLFGILGFLESLLNQVGYTIMDMDISFICIELGIVAFIDLSAGVRYLNILKRRFNYGRVGGNLMLQSVLQMLFGSFISGLLGLIGINSLMRSVRPMPRTPEEQVELINDYKKKAMGEAITRLKELKAQGAISEEVYYETLNKILES